MQNSTFVRPLVAGVLAGILLVPIAGVTRSAEQYGATHHATEELSPMVLEAEVASNTAVWSWL